MPRYHLRSPRREPWRPGTGLRARGRAMATAESGRGLRTTWAGESTGFAVPSSQSRQAAPTRRVPGASSARPRSRSASEAASEGTFRRIRVRRWGEVLIARASLVIRNSGERLLDMTPTSAPRRPATRLTRHLMTHCPYLSPLLILLELSEPA